MVPETVVELPICYRSQRPCRRVLVQLSRAIHLPLNYEQHLKCHLETHSKNQSLWPVCLGLKQINAGRQGQSSHPNPCMAHVRVRPNFNTCAQGACREKSIPPIIGCGKAERNGGMVPLTPMRSQQFAVVWYWMFSLCIFRNFRRHSTFLRHLPVILLK